MKTSVDAILSEELKKVVNPEAKMYFLMMFHKEMFPYIPFDTGIMASSVEIQQDGIHFKTPYATRQYYGDNFNFKKEHHPLATSRWADVCMDLKGEMLLKNFANYYYLR